jgi:putative ABC transport system permease protein
MALGANHAGILGMITRQGLALALAGMVGGLAISWALAQFAASFLYGIDSHDAVTFIAVPVVLLSVALAAILVPARRASRVEPMTALRYE